MRRDEINALRRIGFIVEDVLTAGNSMCEGDDGVVGACPKTSNVVAEFPVPFGPRSRKSADFVEPSGIPSLGNELCTAEHGILGNIGKQAEIRIVNPFAFV